MNRQQQLMLLRLKAMLFGGELAETEESPDLSPELSQVTVLLESKLAGYIHNYIVIRYSVSLQGTL